MLTGPGWIHKHVTSGRPLEPAWSDLDAWWDGYRRLGEFLASALDRAIVGAFYSDRLSFAFASGHQSALRRLLPDLDTDRVAALCISEEGGAHPRQIATRLERNRFGLLRLDGDKRYTTLLPLAEVLLVAARHGDKDDGRPDIRVVRVDADAPGVSKHPMADTPFCPEIPHGITRFDNVAVVDDMVLPGDGYTDVVKAFRTVEDLHVMAGVAGYLMRVAHDNGWSDSIKERLFAVLAALAALDRQDPGQMAAHLGVAGCFTHVEGLISEVAPLWDEVDDASAERWRRDLPVLAIAKTVRGKRRERAWGR